MTTAVPSIDTGECVWLTSDPDIATARERSRALAVALGFSDDDRASIETTISELAIAMLTYARSGEIRIEVVNDGLSAGLRIVARNWGRDCDQLELSGIQGLGDDLHIQSRAGRGTVVTVTKWSHAATFSAA